MNPLERFPGQPETGGYPSDLGTWLCRSLDSACNRGMAKQLTSVSSHALLAKKQIAQWYLL